MNIPSTYDLFAPLTPVSILTLLVVDEARYSLVVNVVGEEKGYIRHKGRHILVLSQHTLRINKCN